jgi:hypothetical protein
VYLKTKIFDPLGMTASSVNYETIKRSANRALGQTPYIRKTPMQIPMRGAAGVFTSASDLSRFVQFHLNHGHIEGRRLLRGNLIDEMYNSFPISDAYGLGIEILQRHDTYYLKHDGSGFGFMTIMTWYPEYGIGGIVLTNTQDCDLHLKLSDEILDSLITKGMVRKITDSNIPTADQLIGKETKLPFLPNIESIHTPTPYQPEWKQYIGTYRFLFTNYKPELLFNIALTIGYCHPYIKVMVYEKEEFLWVGTDNQGYRSTGHEPLEEIQSGLFIAPSGETLDFRGSVPAWKNIRMKKVRNQSQ